MKKIIFALMCLISISCYAESIKEPEFTGQVVVVKSDSTTELLPSEIGNMKAKSSLLGYLPVPGTGIFDKSTVSISVKGVSSSYIMHAKDICLIIRVKDVNENPSSYLRLVKFDVKKKKRETVFAQQSLLSGFELKNDSDSNVAYRVEKYGESSLMIRVKDLSAGQYGIGFMGTMNFSTFAIE